MDNLDKKNIAIIGLGEIGSRHLQALSKITIPSSLYAVDPSNKSTSIAKSRLKEEASNQTIDFHFLNSVEELPKKLALVIISTSSDIRLSILESLFKNKIEVENIVFEKVVFQRPKDFDKAKNLLSKNRIKSWVNCPRRSWPIYMDLRSFLKEKKDLFFILKGGEWGMACNAIHFIDLIEWLTSSEILEIDIDELDPAILESKRKGFIEISGKLKVHYTGQNRIHLFSDVNSSQVPEIEIFGKGFKVCIDESLGKLLIEKDDESDLKEFEIPYQSELSNKIAEDILLRKTTKLPCFDESMRQHTIMLNAFQKHIENTTLTKIDYCPIT